MLNVLDLEFSYGGVKALRGINFSVKPGECIAIIGPNGAGKSTLFSCMTGNKKHVKGKVMYKDKNIVKYPSYKICRMGLGRTFQYPKNFSGLSVLENVMVGAHSRSGDSIDYEEVANECLQKVDLYAKAKQPVTSLSLFEQKRLELAKVIATGVDILLLDEVMSGTRVEEIPLAVNLIKTLLKEGKTILFVEHVMSFVHALAKRVIVIENGIKIADGPLKNTLALTEVRNAYFGNKDA